ncbi:hypothetical protein IEU95_08680 [Hoyosella rhizosphaerae]|uniref:DUF4267 domain-containing protein n=1 Tax=Hoyosella rhizosphaerae TaxID=1755582 RepID=A0A916U148_9ACTN|nr:hypothetical protein [Hoyosella rhizosphaerae]MBN4926904.1 hypothetical protein [Hoyosella rhizosphaerae]GGC55616.1 hypothetical protein GCM10011410_05000 [Hoyosella rhizosphaerae]
MAEVEVHHDSAEDLVLAAIGLGRIVWGATTVLAPSRVHGALGVAYPGPDQGIWIRAFGVRDVVLGAAALHPHAAVRRATLHAGIMMDLFDAGVVLLAAQQGLPRRASAVGVLLAGGTAALATSGPAMVRKFSHRGR